MGGATLLVRGQRIARGPPYATQRGGVGAPSSTARLGGGHAVVWRWLWWRSVGCDSEVGPSSRWRSRNETWLWAGVAAASSRNGLVHAAAVEKWRHHQDSGGGVRPTHLDGPAAVTVASPPEKALARGRPSQQPATAAPDEIPMATPPGRVPPTRARSRAIAWPQSACLFTPPHAPTASTPEI